MIYLRFADNKKGIIMNHVYLTNHNIEKALEVKQITKAEAEELKKILSLKRTKKSVKNKKG